MVIREAKPLAELRRKHPTKLPDRRRCAEARAPVNDLGYLPLASEHRTDWSVVVSLKDGTPKGYLPLDAW